LKSIGWLLLIVLAAALPVSADTAGGSSSGTPEHLRYFPGLYIREDDRIIDASEEDIAVAEGYPLWEDRGEVLDGRRITILTDHTTVNVGEEVRVVHVVEAPESGWTVYIMGPKIVFGEFINGELLTGSEPGWEDPFIPEIYDGAVLESPAVDYNYDITSYSFDDPGIHEIQWILGEWESNILEIEVVR